MGKEKKGKTNNNKDKKEKKGVSVYQALMAYKISNKEKDLDEIKKLLEETIEKNKTLKERNHRLAESKETNFSKALSDYRKYIDSYTKNQHICDRDEVISEMKQIWLLKQNHETELSILRKEIKKVEKEISISKREYKKWSEFKQTGSSKLDTEIRLLKQEIVFMTENYELVAEHLKKNLRETIDQIDKNADETIRKKNKVAADSAFQSIDEDAVKMSHGNEWMLKKIEIFKNELQEIKAETSHLEKENIELMSYLFECSTDDLKYVKNAFQTQFLDDENLEDNSILNVDLEQLESVRPTSGLDIAITKIQELELRREAKMSRPLAICDTNEATDYLKLGSSDFKTLSLKGSKKAVLKPQTPSNDELKAQRFGHDWPITHDMLYDLHKISPRDIVKE